jgi:hypothetical protein
METEVCAFSNAVAADTFLPEEEEEEDDEAAQR